MIYKQSVFEPWPIESETIQAVITSPPYFGLRKYAIPDIIIGGDRNCEHEFDLIDMNLINENRQGKDSVSFNNSTKKKHIHGKKVGHQGLCVRCNAWRGQYGLEPTPYRDVNSYVEHTRLWAKEAWRVLKKDGLFFLNLADSYNGSNKGETRSVKQKSNSASVLNMPTNCISIPSKCQLLIPHRVAMALVDDGWTLRNTVVWFKTNSLPESVTDRFSKKYEYIFMFSKSNKYYFNLDAVREPHAEVSKQRLLRAVSNKNKYLSVDNMQKPQGIHRERKNYKDRIGTMQSTEFGQGDYLVGKLNPLGKNPGDIWSIPSQPSGDAHYAMWPSRLVERMIKCSTKAGDIVLDCFAGSGTTIKKAKELQRIGIGIDLGYHEISSKKIGTIQKQMFV